MLGLLYRISQHDRCFGIQKGCFWASVEVGHCWAYFAEVLNLIAVLRFRKIAFETQCPDLSCSSVAAQGRVSIGFFISRTSCVAMSTFTGMTARMTDRGFCTYNFTIYLTMDISAFIVVPLVVFLKIPGTSITLKCSSAQVLLLRAGLDIGFLGHL